MTEKRYENIGLHIIDGYIRRSDGVHLYVPPEIVTELNNLSEENEQLKQAVEYWKQVAGQYSNELNVFEHCKQHKTECKDIYWNSD